MQRKLILAATGTCHLESVQRYKCHSKICIWSGNGIETFKTDITGYTDDVTKGSQGICPVQLCVCVSVCAQVHTSSPLPRVSGSQGAGTGQGVLLALRVFDIFCRLAEH